LACSQISVVNFVSGRNSALPIIGRIFLLAGLYSGKNTAETSKVPPSGSGQNPGARWCPRFLKFQDDFSWHFNVVYFSCGVFIILIIPGIYYRASACASMQNAILLYHFCSSVRHVMVLRLNE